MALFLVQEYVLWGNPKNDRSGPSGTYYVVEAEDGLDAQKVAMDAANNGCTYLTLCLISGAALTALSGVVNAGNPCLVINGFN